MAPSDGEGLDAGLDAVPEPSSPPRREPSELRLRRARATSPLAEPGRDVLAPGLAAPPPRPPAPATPEAEQHHPEPPSSPPRPISRRRRRRRAGRRAACRSRRESSSCSEKATRTTRTTSPAEFNDFLNTPHDPKPPPRPRPRGATPSSTNSSTRPTARRCRRPRPRGPAPPQSPPRPPAPALPRGPARPSGRGRRRWRRLARAQGRAQDAQSELSARPRDRARSDERGGRGVEGRPHRRRPAHVVFERERARAGRQRGALSARSLLALCPPRPPYPSHPMRPALAQGMLTNSKLARAYGGFAPIARLPASAAQAARDVARLGPSRRTSPPAIAIRPDLSASTVVECSRARRAAGSSSIPQRGLSRARRRGGDDFSLGEARVSPSGRGGGDRRARLRLARLLAGWAVVRGAAPPAAAARSRFGPRRPAARAAAAAASGQEGLPDALNTITLSGPTSPTRRGSTARNQGGGARPRCRPDSSTFGRRRGQLVARRPPAGAWRRARAGRRRRGGRPANRAARRDAGRGLEATASSRRHHRVPRRQVRCPPPHPSRILTSRALAIELTTRAFALRARSAEPPLQLETYVNGELMSSGFVSAGGRKAADNAKDANDNLGVELGVRSGGIGSGGQPCKASAPATAKSRPWRPRRRGTPRCAFHPWCSARCARRTSPSRRRSCRTARPERRRDRGLRDLDLHFVMQLISVCRESTRAGVHLQVSAPVARFRDAERAIEPHSRICVATG